MGAAQHVVHHDDHDWQPEDERGQESLPPHVDLAVEVETTEPVVRRADGRAEAEALHERGETLEMAKTITNR